MSSITVLVPVLGRPHRVEPLVESLGASQVDVPLRVLFLPCADDAAELAQLKRAGAPFEAVGRVRDTGQWAKKINHAFRTLETEWALFAADDVTFQRGWAEEAMKVADRTRCCVIGTNDTVNVRVRTGRHSTHSLVHRDYLECGTIDRDGVVLTEEYGHWYCNPPEAPIWMADCSFKELGDVTVGDEVIGWAYDEADRPTVGRPLRTLCYSTVEKVAERVAPLVRVEMESGRTFRCTQDHRWLNARWSPSVERGRAYAQWVTPEVGRTLLHIVDEPTPIPSELARAAGWLAGLYDGEGSGFVAATQNFTRNPEVIERAHDYLELLGIPYRYIERPSGIADFVLTGGRQAYLDFLLRVQPSRSRQLKALIVGWRRRDSSRRERAPIGARCFGRRDRIVAVEPAGESTVISMTTSSGNYVAWGYASRNCDDELIQTAQYRRTFAAAKQAVVAHEHPNYGGAPDDATYQKGQASVVADQVLFNSRKWMWGK